MFKHLTAVFSVILPSAPTRFLYRLCGQRIGKNVRMPCFSYIHADEITLGDDVDIRRFVFVHLHKFSVGANSIISYGTQIKGSASFSCGDNAFIGVHCIIHCAEDVTLGFYSGMGPRSTVYTHGSFLPVTMGYPAKFAPVIMEDYVWIGMEVTIMPGAHIESNCIINPGVVVQSRIKSNSLIQLSSSHHTVLDLARLQKISKKSVPYYHDKIIASFLKSRALSFQHAPDSNLYALADGRVFISDPEANGIELRQKNGRTIRYDLERFYTDRSRNSFHRDFLAHIRLRFGIALRTRYGSPRP
jgi:acetyltransferase-like isoleucine patch superfamily enzyme